MTFSDQPIPQFLLLTALGLLAVVLGVALVADYKGLTTRYAQRLSKSWQHPWYQKAFVWTDKRRRATTDVRQIRTWVRIPAGGLILIGLIFLAAEIGALATGHVT
jgi:hypothetical protein